MTERELAQMKMDRVNATVAAKLSLLKMAGIDEAIADLVGLVAYALERGDALETELADLKPRETDRCQSR